MAFDAVFLRALVRELEGEIVGARIEKIHQITRDQIIFQLRGDKRLLINGGSNAPRLQLTHAVRDNPAQPPMFCMLLRKHLTGGRITAITQPESERAALLEIEARDELGVVSQRTLVLEAMGRAANLILLDGDGRIIECLRRVDFEMSEKRQVLPGLFYHLPPAPGKRPLTEPDEDALFGMVSAIPVDSQLDKWILDTFLGISPLIAREVVFRALGETDARADENAAKPLFDALCDLRRRILENDFAPTLLFRGDAPAEYTFMPIMQYGASLQQRRESGFSAMLDAFYETRERLERNRQRGQELTRAAVTARDRTARKLAMQEREYAATQERETLRIKGDIITANLYRMRRGESALTAQNFYDESGADITIALDPLLTPQQNAAKYYKQYNKAKTAERVLREQMTRAAADLEYLESVLHELSAAETEQDFADIRAELLSSGYLRRDAKAKREQKRPSRPREFRSTAGLRILVGRNNAQNDVLTTRTAQKSDLWFHTQKIHGSHVILETGGASADEQSILEAAMLAAFFSRAGQGSGVPVDYTPVRYVKKPAGARPGMVVYETYKTVYVTPEEELVKRLFVK